MIKDYGVSDKKSYDYRAWIHPRCPCKEAFAKAPRSNRVWFAKFQWIVH